MKYRNPYFENTDEDPEYEANKVLAQIEWDGTVPIDLLDICEQYGLECIFRADPSMSEPGKTAFRNEVDFYIQINTYNTDCLDGFSHNQTTLRRQRFTLAHEIAHCIFRSHINLKLQQNLSNKNNPHSKFYPKIREDQANQFAAYLLIPRKAFEQFSRQVGWHNIAQLIQQTSEKFDVSLEVAAQQIARLADYPCIAILFDRNGNPKKVPAYSADFQETKLFYSRNKSAPSGTAIAKMLSNLNQNLNQNQQTKKHFSDASIWFPEAPDWRAEKFSVVETSLQTGKYGILTFLEICKIDN